MLFFLMNWKMNHGGSVDLFRDETQNTKSDVEHFCLISDAGKTLLSAHSFIANFNFLTGVRE